MRVIGLLAALAAAAVAAEELTPRTGSGWEGFRPGSWVKIKRTPFQKNRVLTVTLIRTTLEKVGKDSLTLRTVSRNALGLTDESRQVVPRTGDAARGETEKVEKLSNEILIIAGKKLDCARTRATVTGPTGKRVVTKWIAPDPKFWAKRAEVRYDPKGKVTFRSTMLLVSRDEPRKVGKRTIRCLKYRIRQVAGTAESNGDVYTSRRVPGDMVWMELKSRNGDVEVTIRAEVLDFEAK